MIAARAVQGPWRRLRWGVDAGLVALLLAGPWLRSGDGPLLLFDVPARRFYVFGLVIFPSELYFLWLLLALLALALFFFTALAGRLWCGWACPQTVLTDVFAGLARFIEGWQGTRPPARVPAVRRAATQFAWALACLVLGFHVIGYFTPPRALLHAAARGQPSPLAVACWLAVSALVWLDLVVVKQAFCKLLCPYARLQSALFDAETLAIAYDGGRGEPRGGRGRVTGDCVDCGLCVQVCPTGIDIRDGLQLECIGCTQCIDACNGVMTRLGRAPNLIGYRSLAALEGKRGRVLRPRLALCAILLMGAGAALGIALAQRSPLGLLVEHNRRALSQQLADGRVSNAYTLHLENRLAQPRWLRLRLESADGLQLIVGRNPLWVPAASTVQTGAFVVAPAGASGRGRAERVRFVLEDLEQPARRSSSESTFMRLGSAQGGGR